MKENKIGFYNSELQSELGRRPKKKRDVYARNEYVLAALTRGFDLIHQKKGSIVNIGPQECSSLVSVVDKLMLNPLMSDKRQDWINSEKKEKTYVLTGLTRMLTGNIDKNTGKSVFSVMDWRILGININID